MPLNDAVFKTQIKAILEDMLTQTDKEQAKELFATRLLSAVKQYVTSATVTVQVTTVGSATTQTGTGTGTIS